MSCVCYISNITCLFWVVLSHLSVETKVYSIWTLFQIPQGHVWLQGDNTKNSTDSRDYGPVPLAMVISRVLFRVKLAGNELTALCNESHDSLCIWLNLQFLLQFHSNDDGALPEIPSWLRKYFPQLMLQMSRLLHLTGNLTAVFDYCSFVILQFTYQNIGAFSYTHIHCASFVCRWPRLLSLVA